MPRVALGRLFLEERDSTMQEQGQSVSVPPCLSDLRDRLSCSRSPAGSRPSSLLP